MEIKRKKIVRAIFTVKEKIHLAPHYIRVIFDMTEQQLKLFHNVQVGSNNKIFIPAPGTDHVIFPDEGSPVQENAAVKRTYTTRHIDTLKKELWIDFIAHGDNGPASYWANRAVPGNLLGIAMKDGKKPLFPDADEYLFVGDSTALPVIATMLEELPKGKQTKAILEVFSKEDEIILSSPSSLTVEWLHNPNPESGSRLAEVVRNTMLPKGRRFVFMAAENDIIKNLNGYFKDELVWPSDEYSAYAYWRRGDPGA